MHYLTYLRKINLYFKRILYESGREKERERERDAIKKVADVKEIRLIYVTDVSATTSC